MTTYTLYIGLKRQRYYLNNSFYRDEEDGPALIRSDGQRQWLQHNKCHRLNGPALEFADGRKSWYYQNEYINVDNQKDFERYIKLLHFE